jgi:hypothetical protein
VRVIKANLRNRWRRIMTEQAKVVLTIAAAAVVLAVGVWTTSLSANSRAQEWAAGLNPRLIQDSVQEWPATIKGSRLQQVRVKDQMTTIRGRLEHHAEVIIYFMTQQFMVITFATISAVIAAGILLLITPVGWTASKWLPRTIFLLAGVVAAGFASFPALYRQEQNILDNAALYQSYQALRNEMLSYIVTGERLSGNKAPLPEFIHYVDSCLVTLGKLAMGFDPSKIPQGGDLLKQVK